MGRKKGNREQRSNATPSTNIVWHVDSGNGAILTQILGKGPFFPALPPSLTLFSLPSVNPGFTTT